MAQGTSIVRVDLETSADGSVIVWPVWSNVDRPLGFGMSCGKNKALAARYIAAVMAGKVFPEASIGTDVNGKTYAVATCKVMGRYLNADLKKLGF